MPTYQYVCTECGGQLEAVQKFTDEPLTVHGDCGGRLRKVFSPVGIVFKGSGFYRTDSRGSASAASGAPKAGDAAASSGSDSGSSAESKKGSDTAASSSSGSDTSSAGKSSGEKKSSSEKKSSGEKVA